MNEQIRKLYDQALESKFDYGAGAGVKPGEYYSNYITVLNPEKFAELIVRECIDICDAYGMPDGTSPAAQIISLAIKHKFGVKD